MFGLFLVVCVVSFIVWRVRKSNLRVGNSLPDITLDNSSKPSDWGSSTYTPSATTRTTYKPSSSSSRRRSSSSSSSFGSRSGGGFGGGRSGGGGASGGF